MTTHEDAGLDALLEIQHDERMAERDAARPGAGGGVPEPIGERVLWSLLRHHAPGNYGREKIAAATAYLIDLQARALAAPPAPAPAGDMPHAATRLHGIVGKLRYPPHTVSVDDEGFLEALAEHLEGWPPAPPPAAGAAGDLVARLIAAQYDLDDACADGAVTRGHDVPERRAKRDRIVQELRAQIGPNVSRLTIREVTQPPDWVAAAEARAREDAAKDREDAERWRALLASGRIRVLGYAQEATPHMHLGLELWVTFPDSAELAERNRANAVLLTTYADAAREGA